MGMKMLLAGDIGGTKTILALYANENELHSPIRELVYPSGNYQDLETIIAGFLAGIKGKIEKAGFSVAGPVVNGRVRITNLPWVIDKQQLHKTFGFKQLSLLNDIVATANAVPLLKAGDIYTLNAGQPIAQGSIAIVAPGTGLGEAYLNWENQHYCAFASEGGHADFAPTTALELDLLRFLLKRFQHVSYEQLCSGMGIPNIYAFLKEEQITGEPQWLTDELAHADDPTPIIVNNALDSGKSCQICKETLNTFVSILGAEAGNMALKVMATGGVYLGGGIPPRIIPALQQPRFMNAFINKGRMAGLMKQVPVHIILNPKTALLGAAYYGSQSSSPGK